MAEVAIHLRGLSPRWMLLSRPHVVVNSGEPVPLTKAPVSFSVPAGRLDVLVAPSRASAERRVHDRQIEHTWYVTWVRDDEVLRLYFRPAILRWSWFRGRIRPVGSPLLDT